VYRALLTLAFSSADPKALIALLAEARGWLKDHRAAFATLCSLAGGLTLPDPGGSATDKLEAEIDAAIAKQEEPK
jgi:hypothetical protein